MTTIGYLYSGAKRVANGDKIGLVDLSAGLGDVFMGFAGRAFGRGKCFVAGTLVVIADETSNGVILGETASAGVRAKEATILSTGHFAVRVATSVDCEVWHRNWDKTPLMKDFAPGCPSFGSISN